MGIQRIAFLSVHTSPLAPMGGKKTGGMNIYIRELAQELGSRGIQVDVFTRRTSPNEPAIDHRLGPNVRVVYLNAGPVTSLSPDDIYEHLSEFTARLMAFATRHCLHHDCVYSHYWLSGLVAAKLKEAWGTPFAQMFHTLGHMKERIVSTDNIQPNQRITAEIQIVQQADRIIAATPAEQAQLLWLYRARRKKIDVIPPGVNTQRFQPLSELEARSELGFDVECRLLLFVGRIEPLKGIDLVLRAMAEIRDVSPELYQQLCFAIVGGDPHDLTDTEMQRLQSVVSTLGIGDHVRFLGARNQEALPCYYSAATAVVMPSDYESFGMVALEAMASGTPVIASEVGGLAYLVEHGETGYLVPTREPGSLAQRISELISDEERHKQMGHNAVLRAQYYAWPAIANQLLATFKTLYAPA